MTRLMIEPRHARPALVLSMLALFAGCGDDPAPVNDPEASRLRTEAPRTEERTDGAARMPVLGDDEAESDAAARAPEIAQAIDGDELTRYLAALRDLKGFGMRMTLPRADAGAMDQFTSGLRIQDEWRDQLDEHGFEPERFLTVHNTVARAYAALLMDAQRGGANTQMKKSLEAMERMPGVTAEQVAQMREQIEAARRQVDEIAEGVPESIRELVRARKTEVMAAFQ